MPGAAGIDAGAGEEVSEEVVAIEAGGEVNLQLDYRERPTTSEEEQPQGKKARQDGTVL
jgi:hypothetical protein